MAAGIQYSRPMLIEGERVVRGPVDSAYGKMVMGAVVIGAVFVLSASFPLANKTLGGSHPLHFFYRQLRYAGIGLVGLLIACRLAPQQWSRMAPWLFVGGLVAMLACRWSPWAHPVGGAWRWLMIGGQQLQPSEFTKVAYVLLVARFIARPTDKQYTQGAMLTLCLAAMSLMGAALALQKDLGMALLVVGVTLAMLFLRGVDVRRLAWLSLVLGGLGLGAAAMSPTRWGRLVAFVYPGADPMGAGYQLHRMLATIARGGLFGVGIGMCPDKWGALPTPHTDCIFCVVTAELGIVGAILALLLVLMMTGRAFKLAERAGTRTAWYVGCGMGLMLGLQSLINIGVATVSIPCTGLTLPFISYGGSSLIASMAAAGIVLSVSRHARIHNGEE